MILCLVGLALGNLCEQVGVETRSLEDMLITVHGSERHH